MHDVVVVGGGPAGCSVALVLARRGYRVLVLERTGAAPDSSSPHSLSPAAVVLLERWGLLGQLVATGCPPADRTTIWACADRLDLPNPPESPLTYAPRRTILVSMLWAAAADAGAQVRLGLPAKDLVWEGGRVSGVVVTGADGHSVYERSRIVVGADGRNSLVARVVGAEIYHERPGTNCCYHAYWRPGCVVPAIVTTTAPSDSLSARTHFPATAPVIGLDAPTMLRSRRAKEGLPSSRHHPLAVPRPLPRRVPRRCASRLFASSVAFTQWDRARLPLRTFTRRQASLDAADRRVARPRGPLVIPLRRRPLNRRRGSATGLPGDYPDRTRTGWR